MTNETITKDFWPDGVRLVISVSMQFEAGGQPPKGTDSPFPKVDFPESVPSDAAANTWFAYGYREGIPRMLDLWDRHGVKVTSHMIGEAAQRHPELAREIVARGHEAAGHGPRWSSQYAMSRGEEMQFLISARDMVEAATGQRPIGYNCNWLRRGPNTLSLLQELGYIYHIDDLSRDEPFIEQVNGKDFVVVPYTLRNNDILLIEGRNYSPTKFIEQIKMDFDQLYEEGGHRRRMMSLARMTASVARRRWYGPGMSSCATSRVGPGWRSCARTRSRAMRWKASSHCERAKPSDPPTVATLGENEGRYDRTYFARHPCGRGIGRLRLDGRS
jgi:peptidoglycan/xylan/chitin deacetylase (PgdA/CDA1 family)